jgi:hypothetical protein
MGRLVAPKKRAREAFSYYPNSFGRQILRSWAMSLSVGVAMLGPGFAFDSVPAKKGAVSER